MFKNYLKLALRNLWRHRIMSGINMLGLATGIACCLLIAAYVFHETSYDRFHKNADRIVRVTMEFAADGVPFKVAVTGNKVYPAFRRTFPEVENGVRLYPGSEIVKYQDKLFDEKNFLYADSTFFRIFSFRLLRGNPLHVLDKANQVVLTSSAARKYFGGDDPVGKTLRIGNSKNFTVTGIAEDCPANSQIKFDFLASFYSLEESTYKEETWWNANYYTYLLLKAPSSISALQQKIRPYMESLDKNTTSKNYITFHLEPLRTVHLYAKVDGGIEPAGDYRYVYIFSLIAILILVIACANYVNLTTARAAERAREVGVRKVMGALRKQLLLQFLGESTLTVFIALLISFALVWLLLPAFNLVAGRQFTLTTFMQPAIPVTLIAILLAVGLLGGAYPALVISGFQPVKVLKGNFKTGSSGLWLRKGLIVIQFVISVGLIISTWVIHDQLSFIQAKKLGYNKDHIVVLPLDSDIKKNLPAFRSEFMSNAHVLGITTCSQTPAFIPGKYGLSVNGHDMIVTAVRTDRDFAKTLELKVMSGSDFTEVEQQLADSSTVQMPLMINETAARTFGWNDQQAIGKMVSFQGRKAVIKAVVGDFHFSSMHEAITPFVIFMSDYTRNMLVKLSGEQLPQTLQFMEQKWKTLASHRPFEYEFLDDQFNKLYEAETKTGRLFYGFALLAVCLACLGLLGLATFMAQQRTKEIGVRKVLGASVLNIVSLLSKDFLKLVGIAALIAFPLAWWAMNNWLHNFVYRITIQAWVFVAAGAIALLIALITISFQAVKAGLTNPVKNLRTE